KRLTSLVRLRRNHEVDRLGAFALLVRLNLECNALSFVKRLQPGTFNRGDVHKHVAPTIVRFDEAVTSLAVEELYCPRHGHREYSSPQCFTDAPPAHQFDRTFT